MISVRIPVRLLPMLVGLLFLGTIFSCKEKTADEQQVTNSIEKAEPIDQWKQITDVNEGAETIAKNPPHGQPGHRCDLPVGAPLGEQEANSTMSPVLSGSGSNPAVNPPHGEPGHRCDIAVGAPLNGEPSTNQSPVQSVNGSTVKINPAHGQPGHRCDIKVGDPLPE